MLRTSIVVVLALGCGGGNKQTEPALSTPSGPAPASLTADECAAAGGEVVGDIGDGAIHKPDYKCAKSGQPPIGHIKAADGQPMGVEGAVCCK